MTPSPRVLVDVRAFGAPRTVSRRLTRMWRAGGHNSALAPTPRPTQRTHAHANWAVLQCSSCRTRRCSRRAEWWRVEGWALLQVAALQVTRTQVHPPQVRRRGAECVQVCMHHTCGQAADKLQHQPPPMQARPPTHSSARARTQAERPHLRSIGSESRFVGPQVRRILKP